MINGVGYPVHAVREYREWQNDSRARFTDPSPHRRRLTMTDVRDQIRAYAKLLLSKPASVVPAADVAWKLVEIIDDPNVARYPQVETMTHAAIVERREDQRGQYCVVTHAEPTIWIVPEVLAEAVPPGEAPIVGGLERDGDLIRFGTPGEGLGRLTYRLAGEHHESGKYRVHIAERIQPESTGVDEC